MKLGIMRWCIVISVAMTEIMIGGTTGKIVGTVKDAQTGEQLVGVNVLLQGTTHGASSSIDGSYLILNIPPGKYTLVASAVGYSKKTFDGVSVSIDLTTTIDIQLSSEVIDIGKEVVITAERPVVRKDLTSTEARVDASQIKTIPVNEVSEVLTLQAGVTTDAGGGIHIRGGRTNEVAYWVDGVSVSDVYDGSQAVQVDNNSVEELQVISGTFNAEYGQAMSGIVNIVTKAGRPEYHGNISAYVGDYATRDGGTNDGKVVPFDPNLPPSALTDAIYYGLNKFDAFSNRNFEGSFSGPMPGLNDLTFYLSGRYFKSNGWLYGNNIFTPTGQLDINAARFFTDASGQQMLQLFDNLVPMNGRERLSGQAKLSYQVGSIGKISVTALGSKIDYRDYSHAWKLIPNGDVHKYDRGYNISAIWSHTLDPSSFYTANFSYFYKGYKEYLYENPLDASYLTDPFLQNTSSNEFIHGGTNLHHFKRNTETRDLKIDYNNQITKLHEIRAGVEAKLHRLYLEDFNVIANPVGGFNPTVPAETSAEYEQYTRKPVELSAYIQDKLEYERMIVNIGVRFDYFNSKGQVLADIRDPNVYQPYLAENKALTLDERLAKWYKDATAKYSISPRFGISYPITDRGVLHFSYGHFLQIPSFIHLYQKPDYKVTTSSSLQGVYGNPDLKAQRTIMYELGLQQQLNDDLSFDLTGFYRDTRNWVTTGTKYAVGGDYSTATSYYTIYINRDYANSRGMTLSVSKRMSHMFSFNFDYTFQVAEGINSNPDDQQAAQVDNKAPAVSLTPLDWDQTHTANLTFGLGENDWGAFLIGRFGSGLPYTPAINQAEAQGKDVATIVQNNSRRRPDTYTVDVRLFKSFSFSSVRFNVFLKVFNLFDNRNEINVYGETGRATASLQDLGLENTSNAGLVNPISSYLIRPDFYSEPREVQLGAEFEF